MSLIYLDNNATTPMRPQVAEAMRPYLTDVDGNPASADRELVWIMSLLVP
jgi:cysteine desulfurase